MEVYGTERMAQILPYALPAFRDDLAAEVWLEWTHRVLKPVDHVGLEG